MQGAYICVPLEKPLAWRIRGFPLLGVLVPKASSWVPIDNALISRVRATAPNRGKLADEP